MSVSERPIWKTLEKHKLEISKLHLRELFELDAERFSRFSCGADGFFLDYSKNRVTHETMELLLQMAHESGLGEKIDDLFSGKKINTTEDRAVLHTALRNKNQETLLVDGKNIMPEIQATLARMQTISDSIRNQQWLGFSNKPITDIVNLGIGGSDLGPKMVTNALRNYHHDSLRCHFVSNVDSDAIHNTLKQCSPETTLFIIASKTFTTTETLSNAIAAKHWLLKHTNEKEFSKHFIAATSNNEKAIAWGITEDNLLPLWDWVGGRYSLWSAIGLPIAIMIGMEQFNEMLNGAHSIDEHFRTAHFKENVPVILALMGIWNHNFFHYPSNALLPYCDALALFPDHLQQVDMESNGKSIDLTGRKITEHQTGPIIWGKAGTDGQHSFHQLLHQGTAKVYCDFIAPIKSPNPITNQHDILLANCFAQSQALMCGKNSDEAEEELIAQGMEQHAAKLLAPHKIIAGNKPSCTLLFPELSPYYLGGLIALYEHKIFTQGVIWNVNSFDQWGVELGKQLANKILPSFSGSENSMLHDGSTQGLIDYYQKSK
jgi:glucose-6-phosphate isomerase